MHSKLLENVAAETAELNDTPSQLRDNLKRLVDHLMNYVVSRFFASFLILLVVNWNFTDIGMWFYT